MQIPNFWGLQHLIPPLSTHQGADGGQTPQVTIPPQPLVTLPHSSWPQALEFGVQQLEL